MVATVRQDSFLSKGVRINFLESGTGTPVIAMHGFSSTAHKQFGVTGVMAALARDFRVIAVDGRGHGASDKPHDQAVYGPEMGEDLLRLQDHIGVARSHLVGYSLGAMVLANLVCRRPERFVTCVLGGATGRFNWTADKQKQLELEASELAQGSTRSQILRLWPPGKPLPSDSEIAEMSRRALEGQDVVALAASRLGGGRLVVRPEQLAAVRVPVLGVVGTLDPYDNDFLDLQAIMPQIQVVRIEGTDHSTTPSHPQFVATISIFLKKHQA